MRALLAVLLICVTACAPVTPSPVAAVGAPSKPAAGCEWVSASCTRTGMACAIIYQDAGKACTESDQCQGRCMAKSSAEGRFEGGVCENNSARCTCEPEVIDGVPATEFMCTAG